MALRRALFNAPAGLFIVKIVATTPVLPFLLIETQGSRLSLPAFVDLLFRYRKRVFCRNICHQERRRCVEEARFGATKEVSDAVSKLRLPSKLLTVVKLLMKLKPEILVMIKCEVANIGNKKC